MKIVHLISGGDIGGAKTYIETLLPCLCSAGAEVWLLCVMEGALTAECRSRGINVNVIPQNGRSDLSVVKKMAEWINAEKFDIIHCHGARANFIAFFLRFLTKAPMVTTIHSDYRLDFAGGGYRQWLYTPLNVISLKRFRYFITISDGFRKMLIERGFKSERIEVIYNGVDFSEARPTRSKYDFLSEYGIRANADTTLIGCVARLHPVKGVDVLLKAAEILVKNKVNAIVLIAGSGNEKQTLLTYAQNHGLNDKVHFLGFVDDVASFYSAIDINVIPSRSEGFSLTTAEGARYKLNTVASRTGGIPEVIKDGETGVLFPPGDYKRLAEILIHEIENPHEGKERGERLFDDVSKRFSLENTTQRHLEVYRKILYNNKKSQ